MKTVLAVVMLAVGLTLGLAAGLVIRNPDVIAQPEELLPRDAPNPCLELITAGEEMESLTQDYLALVRDTYVPVIHEFIRQQQAATLTEAPPAPSPPATPPPSPAPSQAPVVRDALTAEQKLADLGERTTAVTSAFNEAKVACRAQLPEWRQ